ncbi:MAG: DUF2341 domain-containing protein [Candidatus Diapherotrites archaeon]|nr:DUF2341 domain-containing protein [Candidatus Diapherotrites archaeon]
MQKGISPVVAAVLLITISVIAGASLYFWSTSKITPKKEPAKPVPITIRPISTAKGTFLVTNAGTESITLASLATDEPEVTCDFRGNVTILPQGSARCYMPPKRGAITVYGTATNGPSIPPVSLSLGEGDVPEACFFSKAISGWADSSCNYRMKITMNNSESTENLVDFPLLVKLTSSRIDYSRTSATDIRFYDADGSTLLPKETEEWNASGDSFIWVKVPQIDAGSTSDYIWAYYNCSNTNSDNPASVWDSSFITVFHLNEDSGGVVDSTSNNYNGTVYPIPETLSSCESTSDWTGTDLSLDSSEPREGNYTIKDVVASPVAGDEYKITYNPSGVWDLKNKMKTTFWFKSDRASTAFTHARVYVYDSDSHYRYWNLEFDANEWKKFWLSIPYLYNLGRGGKDNSDGGSRTTVTNCESTTDWSTNNPYGSISIQKSNKEGDNYVQLYIKATDMTTNTDYHLRYNPPGSWDWSGNSYLYFLFAHCVPCGEYNYLRFYIYDTDGDWAYWDLYCQYANWRPFVINLSAPTAEAPGGLNLSKADYIQWVVNRSAFTRAYQNILIDWVRLDDLNTEKVDRIEWNFKAADTTAFTRKIDIVELDSEPRRIEGKSGNAIEFDRKNNLRTDTVEPKVDGSNITVSLWFKPDVSDLSWYSWLFYKRWGLAFYPNRISGACWDQAGGKGIAITGVTWEDKWYFAVFRVKQESTTDNYDGEFKIWLYDDNGLVGSNSRNDFGRVSQSDGYYWYFSNPYWACFCNDYFDGIIDEVRISDTARSASWIEASYLSGRDQMNTFSDGGHQANLTYTVNYAEGLEWVALKESGATVVNETISGCETFYTNTYSNYSSGDTYTVYYKGCDGNSDSRTYSP